MFRLYETLSSGLLVIGCLSLCVASALYLPGCSEEDKVSGAEVDDNGTAAQEELQNTLRGPGNTPYPGLPLIKSASSAIAVQNYTGSDTTNPLHPENLVEDLLISGCLQAANITFAGNRTQIGRFDRESDNPSFPLESGIIISTGNVLDAEGPNDQGDTTTEFTDTGDADLQSLAGYDTNDRAILTFNFVPDGDTVEFPEWACSQYNDVFGFFVSGPGISGPFSNNAINVALLPDSTPVAINDIHVGGWNQNAGENSHNPATCPDINASYYVNIPAGATTTQFDGRTTVLTARLENLTPCATYSIKIAIGDTSDRKYDSAVFLEAKSFSSDVEIENIYLGAEAYDVFQGCSPNEIRFFRGEGADTSQALDVTYEIAGTAIPGTHHNLASGTVTIPADQAYVAVPYTVPVVPIDGTKTIVVRVNIACTCDTTPVWVEQTIRIHDPF